MGTAVHYPMISIEFHREEIPVEMMSPATIPDELWKHIDTQGHGHFWKKDKLPTLVWVVTGTTWVGDEYDGEEVDIGEYRCRLCGEIVEPKKKAVYGPRFIPGLAMFTVSIDGETFTLSEEKYAKSVEQWAKALRKSGP